MTAYRSRLVISAPFGNYFHTPGALPTYGTYTLRPRPGRWSQVLRTVRHVNGGWINRLGLRNPGLESYATWYRDNYFNVPVHIVSVHGFSTDDWFECLRVRVHRRRWHSQHHGHHGLRRSWRQSRGGRLDAAPAVARDLAA